MKNIATAPRINTLMKVGQFIEKRFENTQDKRMAKASIRIKHLQSNIDTIRIHLPVKIDEIRMDIEDAYSVNDIYKIVNKLQKSIDILNEYVINVK